jgi:hypothetical protein
VLYEQARRHAGRAACPSVVIMDGQPVKTTERGGARANLGDDDRPCLNPPYAKLNRPCMRLFKHPLSSRTRKVVNRAATTLRLAAMLLGRTETPLGAFYRRKRAQLGAPKAITATTRFLSSGLLS